MKKFIALLALLISANAFADDAQYVAASKKAATCIALRCFRRMNRI